MSNLIYVYSNYIKWPFDNNISNFLVVTTNLLLVDNLTDEVSNIDIIVIKVLNFFSELLVILLLP